MSKTKKLALAAAIPLLLLAGCSDFLKGPGLNSNPNQPTAATPNQLWVGVEVAVMAQWENYPMMLFTTWAQQIAGVNRQWQTYASYNSGTDNTAADGLWIQTYGPGGLRDIRAIEDAATTNGAIQWRGQAEVLEALYMGTAADVWGDVPYSNALSGAPTFDTQSAVYTQVLALLNSAITDLGSADGKIPDADFFFNNDAAKWKAAAHTLRARFYMHTAQTAAGVYSAATLTSVFNETALGITATANDLIPNHTSSPGSQNLFYSFQFSRAGDVSPAATHINLIKEAGENSLLSKWYLPNANGNFYGSVAGLPGDAANGIPADSVSFFEVSVDPAAAWGIVTYAENQMLQAEAMYRGAGGGSPATALSTLNAYRASQGQTAVAPAPTGSAILAAILREKFVRNFFNMEVWNDYIRTCYPNIPQPAGVNKTYPYVPGRMPVGYTEASTNANMPTQPTGNPPNANVFKQATSVDGSACIGEAAWP